MHNQQRVPIKKAFGRDKEKGNLKARGSAIQPGSHNFEIDIQDTSPDSTHPWHPPLSLSQIIQYAG